ncbi:uncharacterized protein STEHIDRAFT_125936 [Stereum hirsutum FP-91666 SS1]|uniref:Protein kinase domain-containing protein n=1 Tax=Stereum hirsutum (strain FP-91666) TaxID=721885 RepID=R7RZV6_STEHR|nr:uncharacterized protein STEHIDRAFT_125936 [Stereum hirsutum FP-91666 SS1]EIM80383.1 hypothetical protein STEHIDRAFT_125936 [Stereum hirsutum FP-91666 SS1]
MSWFTSRRRLSVQAEVPWPGWLDDEAAKALTDPSSDDSYALNHDELKWVHVQPWLLSKGYDLRPRFRPGWVPSWGQSGAPRRSRHEDAIIHGNVYAPVVMDAVRRADGRRVLIKRVSLAHGGRDVAILEYLASKGRASDPRNHTIPLLDVIRTPPFRYITLPEFDTLGEGIDFMDQSLEGLVFLHEHRVAHRDCSITNIVMDSKKMYPRGLHADASLDAQGRMLSGARTRTQAGGVKYYFIDFGESILFAADEDARIKEPSKASIHAPETRANQIMPYDAFKPDIYTLGKTFQEQLIEEFVGDFGAFKPLIESMIQINPDERPTAAQALDQLRTISSAFSRTDRHRRAHWKRYHDPWTAPVADAVHMISEVLWVLRTWKW